MTEFDLFLVTIILPGITATSRFVRRERRLNRGT